MAEHWTCIECEDLYDNTDGDTDERMCNKCLNTIRSEKMNIEETQLYMNEQHRLMMRILSILEYSNLQDLKTINSFLFENGFVSKSDEAKSGHE